VRSAEIGLVRFYYVGFWFVWAGQCQAWHGLVGLDPARQDLELYTLGVARRDRLPTLTLSLKKR
jgi:hypothetical protein